MDIPFVEVGAKRNLDYLVDCLSKFNRGANEIVLRSVVGSVSKGMRVAQILLDSFNNIELGETRVEKIKIADKQSLCLKINLKFNDVLRTTSSNMNILNKEFRETQGKLIIKYPIYSILIDYLLYNNTNIYISNSDQAEINDRWSITITKDKWNFKCCAESNLTDNEKRRKMYTNLCAAYYRSGLLVPQNWKEIAAKLSQTDDVVIGIDTNILLNSTLSEHFLYSLYLINSKDYVQTPNWVLVVIPSAVIHELEQGTNSRDVEGNLSMYGRVGFRALGEILELTQCIDLAGISLIISGEANPILDLRVELRGLREDYAKTNFEKKSDFDKKHERYISPKTSSGDTIIRDQFKNFLRKIDFFDGGSFFLTTDKTNAALAQTEGLQAIYYKLPYYVAAQGEVGPYSLACNDGTEDIVMPVSIGKVIYELAVQFGSIKISWDKTKSDKQSIEVFCDKKGESLDHWLHKNLLISKQDFEKICKFYSGKVPLDSIKEGIWDEIVRQLVKGDIY